MNILTYIILQAPQDLKTLMWILLGGAPGDVVKAMNGKTIEIGNTDAEGRLVLADAVAYANSIGLNRIVDVATLTGAVTIATRRGLQRLDHHRLLRQHWPVVASGNFFHGGVADHRHNPDPGVHASGAAGVDDRLAP